MIVLMVIFRLLVLRALFKKLHFVTVGDHNSKHLWINCKYNNRGWRYTSKCNFRSSATNHPVGANSRFTNFAIHYPAQIRFCRNHIKSFSFCYSHSKMSNKGEPTLAYVPSAYSLCTKSSARGDRAG
jgi:hypothetical protein